MRVVELTVVVRYVPGLTVRCGTRVARPLRSKVFWHRGGSTQFTYSANPCLVAKAPKAARQEELDFPHIGESITVTHSSFDCTKEESSSAESSALFWSVICVVESCAVPRNAIETC